MISQLTPDFIPQVCVSGEVLHIGYAPEKFHEFSQIKLSFRGFSVVRKEKKKLLLVSKSWIRAAFWLDSRILTADSVCPVADCPCKEKNLICASFPLPRNLPSSYIAFLDGIEVCYQIDLKAKLKPGVPLPKGAQIKKEEVFLESKAKILVFSCVRATPSEWPSNRRRHSQAGAMGRSVTDMIMKKDTTQFVPFNTDRITIEMVTLAEKNSYFFGEDIKLRVFIDNDSELSIKMLHLSLIQELTFNDHEIEFREKQQLLWKKQLKQWKKTGTLASSPDHQDHSPLVNSGEDDASRHKICTTIQQIIISDRFPLEPGKAFSDSSLLFPLKDYSSSFAPTIRGVPLFRIEYYIQATLSFQGLGEKALGANNVISPVSRLPLQIFVMGSAAEIPSEKERTDLFQHSGQMDPVLSGREKDMDLMYREVLIPDPLVQQYYASTISPSAVSPPSPTSSASSSSE